MAERAGKPTLADAGRADDEQVLVSLDPVAGDELVEQCLVEAARRLHVDILDDGVLAQAGEAQAADQPLVLALGGLAVDQQREPLLEGKRGDVGLSLLFLEGLRHAGEPERDEAVEGGMGQHRLSPFFSGSSQGRGCWRAGSVVASGGFVVGVGSIEPVLQDRVDRAVGRGADVVAAPQAASRRAEP